MAILKKDLQVLSRDIKALERKMAKLIAAAEKGEKAKTTKRAPVKKAPPRKKTAQPTATDQVLNIIKRSKNGVKGQKGTGTLCLTHKKFYGINRQDFQIQNIGINYAKNSKVEN